MIFVPTLTFNSHSLWRTFYNIFYKYKTLIEQDSACSHRWFRPGCFNPGFPIVSQIYWLLISNINTHTQPLLGSRHLCLPAKSLRFLGGSVSLRGSIIRISKKKPTRYPQKRAQHFDFPIAGNSPRSQFSTVAKLVIVVVFNGVRIHANCSDVIRAASGIRVLIFNLERNRKSLLLILIS